MGGFSGFPKQGLALLKALGNNNHKVWMDAHRSEIDEFLSESPFARYLKFQGIHAYQTLPLPEAAHSKKLVTFGMGHFRALAPLHIWLNEALSG